MNSILTYMPNIPYLLIQVTHFGSLDPCHYIPAKDTHFIAAKGAILRDIYLPLILYRIPIYRENDQF